MVFRSLEQGIAAIQAGNAGEGARLIRISLKKEELPANIRAVAYLWLAETNTDFEHKRTCFNDALKADPTNPDVQQRLAALLAAQLPPPPMSPIAPPPPPMSIPEAPPMSSTRGAPRPTVVNTNMAVGILGGPNGLGTAFFVAPNGLLATSRYVVGGLESLTVETQPGQRIPGRVVRSFPDMDLALVQIDLIRENTVPQFGVYQIAENAPLTALVYGGAPLAGRRRTTRRLMEEHWFPTSFVDLADAGGNPIVDDNQHILGMLTKNASRTSEYVYGLHIGMIRKCVESYLWELRGGPNRAYCPCCGSLSQAGAMGFFYCEVCGATLPQSTSIARRPIAQAEAFYDPGQVRCPHPDCSSRAGFHNGVCLRCGRPPEFQQR
ncbi:MAG: serine protease [Burkholderiales bacterium]|nr:serine protease [Anaerolineae bacterium]